MKKLIVVIGVMTAGMVLERVFNLTEIFVLFSTYLVILFGLRERLF